jgi:hypothetical protein
MSDIPNTGGEQPAFPEAGGSRLVFPQRGASCNRASMSKPAAALATDVMRAWRDGQLIAQRARSSANGKWYLTNRPAWNWALMEYRIVAQSLAPDGQPMVICPWPSDTLDGANSEASRRKET